MNVLDELKRQARARAQREIKGCPLPPSEAQRWVDFCVSRVTPAHAAAAAAWSARFVLEYGDLIRAFEEHHADEPEPDRKLIAKARERLEWWKRVQVLGGSAGGYYDSIGTRDRLRCYLRGDYDDELDACLLIYGDEQHARAIVAALEPQREAAE
jgi:hypothetical protein